MLKRFLKANGGGTAIEYTLIAALIAIVLVASLQAVGAVLEGAFDKIDQDVNAESVEK